MKVEVRRVVLKKYKVTVMVFDDQEEDGVEEVVFGYIEGNSAEDAAKRAGLIVETKEGYEESIFWIPGDIRCYLRPMDDNPTEGVVVQRLSKTNG